MNSQIQESAFKPCFDEKGIKAAIAHLHQIKDLRNKRAHEVSSALNITAREAYNCADAMSKVFEQMKCAVPAEITRELYVYRL